MGKFADDSVLDAGLNIVKNNGTQLCICVGQPVSYAEATGAKLLAVKTGLTPANFTGPVDDTSGRKLTVNAQTTSNASATGTADHVAICSGSVLLYVTTITAQVVTTGNPCNIPAFKVAFPDVV